MVGTVTISLEVELAWGLAHVPDAEPLDRHSPRGEREREALERLVALCDDLNLPISFDIIGHLLLDACDGDHGGPHPLGWFDADPGTDRERDPLYYGPDLADRILTADVDHELCTHTFSHARCDRVDGTVIDWELSRVAELHEDRGLGPIESFVPPVHAPPPADVLRDHGIRTVRRPTEYRPPVEKPDPPERALDRAVWRLHRSHPVETVLRRPTVVDPNVVDGLVETYTPWHASLTAPYLQNGTMPPHPVYGALPRSLRQRWHRRYLLEGLHEVAANGGAIHYWSHLFNLCSDEQWPPVESFLRTLAEYRDREAIRIERMVDLGRRVA